MGHHAELAVDSRHRAARSRRHPRVGGVQLTASYRGDVASDPDTTRMTNTFGTHAIAIGRSPDGPESARERPSGRPGLDPAAHRVRQRCQPLLARGASRHREIAVRSRTRRSPAPAGGQLLLESGVLALLGALALLVVRWGGFAMRTFLLPDVDWVDDPLDLRTATFAAVATLLTVLLAGLAPALTASRGDLNDVPKGGRRAGTAPRHHRFRRGLPLPADRALDGARGRGAFVRSLRNVLNLDLGFDRRGLLTANLELEPQLYGPERCAWRSIARGRSWRLFRAYQG